MTTVPLPEPVNHINDVRELLAAVRSVRDRIQGFVHNRPQERKRLNFNASISDQFFESCATGIEASTPLGSASQTTPALLRDVISYSQAYGSLADELELTFRGLRYTIAQKRAEMAQLAMQTYALAKGLNRPIDGDVLVPHVQAMKRSLKRKRKAAPAVEPSAAPVPVGGAS
jgi:hypothetical protein